VGLDENALSPGERRRADALRRPTDRADFVAAHLLVRVCAARQLAVEPARVPIVQRCERCAGDHGRPEVPEAPELGVSLSHARGYVAAAAGAGPLGVDVEPVVAIDIAGDIAGTVLATGELAALAGLAPPAAAVALTRQWVRKEALVKIGILELDGFAGLDLSMLPSEPVPGGRTVHRSVPGHAGINLVDWVDPDADILGAAVTTRPASVERATPAGWTVLPPG
jgi:4'-phosphopantetheinyl transferase